MGRLELHQARGTRPHIVGSQADIDELKALVVAASADPSPAPWGVMAGALGLLGGFALYVDRCPSGCSVSEGFAPAYGDYAAEIAQLNQVVSDLGEVNRVQRHTAEVQEETARVLRTIHESQRRGGAAEPGGQKGVNPLRSWWRRHVGRHAGTPDDRDERASGRGGPRRKIAEEPPERRGAGA